MSDLIKLTPIFHEKIWGGRQLETVFGYDIPEGPIGECWAISAHPSGDCPIARGAYRGMTLSRLWDMHPELFGRTGFDRFPLLELNQIGFLDSGTAFEYSISHNVGDRFELHNVTLA